MWEQLSSNMHARFQHHQHGCWTYYTQSLRGVVPYKRRPSGRARVKGVFLSRGCRGALRLRSYANTLQEQSCSAGGNNVLGLVKPQSAGAGQMDLFSEFQQRGCSTDLEVKKAPRSYKLEGFGKKLQNCDLMEARKVFFKSLLLRVYIFEDC